MTDRATAAKRGRNPRFPYVPVTVSPAGRTSQVLGAAFADRADAIAFAQKAIDLRDAHYAAAMVAYAKRHAGV